MKDDDLNTYVSRFKTLATTAGYAHNNPETVDIFVQGLARWIVFKILDRETTSDIFKGWVAAT